MIQTERMVCKDTPHNSENDAPITCGVGGEAFDYSNCTLKECFDVTADNRNLSDEDILPRPCSGSPKRTKKLRMERDTSSIRERTRSKIRTVIQQRK
jgi:hypothetical protein